MNETIPGCQKFPPGAGRRHVGIEYNVAMNDIRGLLLALLLLILLWPAPVPAEPTVDDEDVDFEHFGEIETSAEFDDRPLEEPISLPSWFKLSFLDLGEDLNEALQTGKRGLIVYFGQKYCAYCKALLSDLSRPDTRAYLLYHFDIIGIDIHGDRTVTDIDGREYTEREFSRKYRINLTPTLLFYDAGRKPVFRLRGYYPPYQMRAALRYLAEGYDRKERFADYLERAGVPLAFEGELNTEPFILDPPWQLDRSRIAARWPLLVLFERPRCHACDILHNGPFRDPVVRQRLWQIEVEQLPFDSDRPVVTPGGRVTTAKDWARDLGLFYAPALLFFDEQGREIMRVDSVVQLYRLRNILEYITTGGWKEYDTFQEWRRSHGAPH